MSNPLKIGIVITAVLLTTFLVLRWLVQRASPMPENIGVENGRLAPCPTTPNCVSTQADDDQHSVDPIPLTGDPATAHQKLLDIIQSMPRSRIITTDDNYIHAEFRSLTWGFVDDVEFYIDEDANLIHFRSAARLGEGDLGANRNRMEEIRERFAE